MNLPIAYILLKFNFAVELVFVVAIVISQLCLLARLHLLRGMIGLHAREFLRKVYFNVLIVTILAGGVPFIFIIFCHQERFLFCSNVWCRYFYHY